MCFEKLSKKLMYPRHQLRSIKKPANHQWRHMECQRVNNNNALKSKLFNCETTNIYKYDNMQINLTCYFYECRGVQLYKNGVHGISEPLIV